ncbi:hypothetical protein FB451DRAFT_1167362 [Mycena latifolia]|nr:hypothetical protein FB451DRAFT_1167362 [Mycena latifolia]
MEMLFSGMMPRPLGKAIKRYKTLKDHIIRSGLKPKRPCVILPSREAETDAGICLVATFGKKNDIPLRSCPEWFLESEQWIVAIATKPKKGKSTDLGHWSSRGVHLCDQTLLDLVESCCEKRMKWEQKVKAGTSDVTVEYFLEMLASKYRHPDQSSTTPSSQKSRRPQDCWRNWRWQIIAPSIRSKSSMRAPSLRRIPMEPTIMEAPEEEGWMKVARRR